MDEATKTNLSNRNIWVRILYMVLFAIAYSIAETVLVFVAILQVLAVLFTGRVHDALHQFGANVSGYIYHVLQYMTFNSEELPFPFTDWVTRPVGETPYSEPPEDTAPTVTEADDAAANVSDHTTDESMPGTDADDVDTPSDTENQNAENPNKPSH